MKPQKQPTWDDVDEVIQNLKDNGYEPTLIKERALRDYSEKSLELGFEQP